MLLQASAGTEYLLPWVKSKLPYWHAEMQRLGLQSHFKTIFVDSGVQIFVNMTHLGRGVYNDQVRIVGGGFEMLAMRTGTTSEFEGWALRRPATDQPYEAVKTFDFPGGLYVSADLEDLVLVADEGLRCSLAASLSAGVKFLRGRGAAPADKRSFVLAPDAPAPVDDIVVSLQDGSLATMPLYRFGNAPAASQVSVEYNYDAMTARADAAHPTLAQVPAGGVVVYRDGTDQILDVRRLTVQDGSGNDIQWATYAERSRIERFVKSSSDAGADFTLLSTVSGREYGWQISGGAGWAFKTQFGHKNALTWSFVAGGSATFSDTGAYSNLFNDYSAAPVGTGTVLAPYLGNDPFASIYASVGGTAHLVHSALNAAGTGNFCWSYAQYVRCGSDEYWFINSSTKVPTVAGGPSYQIVFPAEHQFKRLVIKNGVAVHSSTASRTETAAGVWADATPVDFYVPLDGVRIDSVDWFGGYVVRQSLDGTAAKMYPAQFTVSAAQVKVYTDVEVASGLADQREISAVQRARCWVASYKGVYFVAFLNPAETSAYAAPLGDVSADAVALPAGVWHRRARPYSSAA